MTPQEREANTGELIRLGTQLADSLDDYIDPSDSDVLDNVARYRELAAELSADVPAPAQPDKKARGIYRKYNVTRTDGKPVEWCFVLEDRDPLALEPLATYAYLARKAGYGPLADDLERKLTELGGLPLDFEPTYVRGVRDWDKCPEPSPPSESAPAQPKVEEPKRPREWWMRKYADGYWRPHSGFHLPGDVGEKVRVREVVESDEQPLAYIFRGESGRFINACCQDRDMAERWNYGCEVVPVYARPEQSGRVVKCGYPVSEAEVRSYSGEGDTPLPRPAPVGEPKSSYDWEAKFDREICDRDGLSTTAVVKEFIRTIMSEFATENAGLRGESADKSIALLEACAELAKANETITKQAELLKDDAELDQDWRAIAGTHLKTINEERQRADKWKANYDAENARVKELEAGRSEWLDRLATDEREVKSGRAEAWSEVFMLCKSLGMPLTNTGLDSVKNFIRRVVAERDGALAEVARLRSQLASAPGGVPKDDAASEQLLQIYSVCRDLGMTDDDMNGCQRVCEFIQEQCRRWVKAEYDLHAAGTVHPLVRRICDAMMGELQSLEALQNVGDLRESVEEFGGLDKLPPSPQEEKGTA